MLDRILAENTPYAIALALLTVGLLVWRFKPSRFRSLPWQSFAIAAALFWGLLAAALILYAWDFYYSSFAPPWYRLAAPLAAIVVYPLTALLFRWIALRLPGNPIAWFCLLGGLESIAEHAIAIYRLDILRIPYLRGTSAASIFLFAFFEYIVYWGATLWLSVPAGRLWDAWRRRPPRSHGPQVEY